MNLQGFLESYPEVLFGHTNDEIFTFYRLFMHGMCSARFGKLLNHACRFLGKDECYLEIGTYAGFTLLSAGYESGKKFFGVDNFSQNFSIEGKVQDKLLANLAMYPGDYTIIDGNFRNIVLEKVLKERKIGVFLIDGEHVYQDVMDSFLWAEPYLSDKAVVFFDDLNVSGVYKAVEELKQGYNFQDVFFANSFFDGSKDNGMSSDKYIHNGFNIMAYEKGVVNV